LQDTRENSEENLRLAREGQITERFTRAIDQLGATDEANNKKLEIRLGGIYALERIAGDSLAMEDSPGRDYSTVVEVLTAYVRENTPQAPGPSEGSSEAASLSNEATVDADEGAEQAAPPGPGRPSADIQVILDVLSRTQNRVPEEYRTRLDLHEANLQGANLQGSNLQGSNLYEADLHEADLHGANLREANLQGANLARANLQRAYLQGAVLLKANLQGAYLQESNLQRANLARANLQGAHPQRANLQGASLAGADLQGAVLFEANLQGASLVRANLQRAKLQRAEVTDEQLADALSLQGATMPDGQKYEDWLKYKQKIKQKYEEKIKEKDEDWLNWFKDKEGSGKDGQNE
jgi:hypothetical protein